MGKRKGSSRTGSSRLVVVVVFVVAFALTGSFGSALAWALAAWIVGVLLGRRRSGRGLARSRSRRLAEVEARLQDQSRVHASRYGFRVGAPGQSRSEARLVELEAQRDRLRKRR